MGGEKKAGKDLGAVFDAHIKAEFVDMDVAATMATMAPEPYLTHVPTLTGGTGRAEVERFYRDHFVGHWPDDVQVKTLSRTIGHNRVVDELIVSFTHDREMRVYLPDGRRRIVLIPSYSSAPFSAGCAVSRSTAAWLRSLQSRMRMQGGRAASARAWSGNARAL